MANETGQGGDAVSDSPRKNPLRTVIRYAVWIFLTLLLIYVLLNAAVAELQYLKADSAYATKITPEVIARVQHVSDRIETITGYAWEFFVPFLQLALLFLIIDWLLTRFGIDVLSRKIKLDWSIQTVIALIVISAFAIAALGGLQGVGSLKDVALVVVGFYFGSQRKLTEIQTPGGTVSTREEGPAESATSQERSDV
jgi:hypothetical protein